MDRRLVFVLAFVLLIANVSALGVTPGKMNLAFVAGQQQEVSLTIVNSESQDLNLVISAQGELQDSILIPTQVVRMTASETSKQVSFNVKMPQTLAPGSHKVDVMVVQLPDSYVTTGETAVGAVVAVLSQVVVNVPYPGKYAEATLNVLSQEDGSVKFIVLAESKGEFDLTAVRATVDVMKSGEKIATVNTDQVGIPSGQRRELIGTWMPQGASLGIYEAVVAVSYDEGTVNLNKEFELGEKKLVLGDIKVNDFSLGEIAKFEILVENTWSEKINGAYSEMVIYGDGGNVLADVKSPTYDIASNEKELMLAYWDTEGVREDSYDASLFLKYGETSEKQDLILEVYENSIVIVGFGYNISSLNTGGGSLIKILIGVIVFLVLVNLSWFVYLRKKVRK